jgi:hypothetical protein
MRGELALSGKASMPSAASIGLSVGKKRTNFLQGRRLVAGHQPLAASR